MITFDDCPLPMDISRQVAVIDSASLKRDLTPHYAGVVGTQMVGRDLWDPVYQHR